MTAESATADDMAPQFTALDGMSHTIPYRHLVGMRYSYVLLSHVIPLVGALTAIALIPWMPPTVLDIAMALALWALTIGVGISVGYHRLFSHRAFRTPTAIAVVITILGSMAAQGPLIIWVSLHRRHHQFSDAPGDPHSPWLSGPGLSGWLRGFWHAHFGWLLTHDMPDPLFYAPDLLKDKTLNRTSRLFLVWYLLGLGLPALIGGVVFQSWAAALTGFLWAGCLRVAVGLQLTWSINSICHLFGRHTHDTGDHSMNLAWLAIPSFGESWHNNHHQSPAAAAFGRRWWQVDLGYLFILTLKRLGMAQEIKPPRSSTAREDAST
ncbi:MAG: acyl-CoA desaturase [Planctomycetia bacterium]|nr:acyl-CoA desaturase [Planctomycetia bacterium]